MELLANAIDPRYYGEDELHEHGQDTGGEQSMGNYEMTTACSYL